MEYIGKAKIIRNRYVSYHTRSHFCLEILSKEHFEFFNMNYIKPVVLLIKY